MRALLVEDYELLRDAVAQGLREAGFAVDAAADGEEGLWHARGGEYDVIVLDLMLPRIPGLTVLKRLREKDRRTPVLILTARDAPEDRIAGLDAGADDYLIKPFVFAELLARVRAMVRRKYEARSPVIQVGDLEIDTTARCVRRGGETVPLSAREYALLELLALRPGHVVTRTEIRAHLYECDDDDSASNVIDVFIAHLRRKLERPDRPRLIHTRRGLGYVLAQED